MVTPVGTWRQTDLTLHGFVVSQTHVEDSLSVVYRPAVSAVWSVKLRVHSWASIHVFDRHTHTHTHTHTPTHQHTGASHSIPPCPAQIFLRVPETDSLIWFTLPPSLPSCLDSHLLYFLFQTGETDGGRGGSQLGGAADKNIWGCVLCKSDALYQRESVAGRHVASILRLCINIWTCAAERWGWAGTLWHLRHDFIMKII